MKKKIQKSKSMTLLKIVAAVLFAMVLIMPHSHNRLLVTGIAIIGICGTLLLLIFPKKVPVHPPKFQKKSVPDSSKPKQSDTEVLLWRQINFQITNKLRAAFPDATWEYVKEASMKELLDGNLIRIRTRNTGSYNFAEFHLNPYGYLHLELLTVETLKQHPKSTPDQELPQEDPQSWYSLIGKPILVNLIGDLQAKGYQKLFINESGEIFIRNGNTPEVKGTFEHFPSKNCWSALSDILIKDELDVTETEHELELTWAV